MKHCSEIITRRHILLQIKTKHFETLSVSFVLPGSTDKAAHLLHF